MNRNQIVFLILPFVLLFGYQNCQKSNMNGEGGSSTSSSSVYVAPDMQVIPLANENIESLQLKSEEVVQIQHGNSSYSLLRNLIYDFDIRSGELLVIDEEGQTNVRYCLTAALKNEITQLLYSSSVCKNNSTSQNACSQVIQDGYANLITQREQFRLGSATDGCGSHSVELCDGSAVLQNWFNDVKVQLSQLQCQ